jgi:4,5-dihydroxyphthalate decarboxylase
MQLSLALIRSGLTEPVLDGAVLSADLQLKLSTANVDQNTRGMLAGKYDVAEMSIATYTQAKTRGADFVALPIFLSRRFMQPGMYYHPDAGLKAFSDIAGKRCVVPQYWLTSSLWHRAILEHEFGVAPASVSWLTVNGERIDAAWPTGVQVTQVTDYPELSSPDRVLRLVEKRRADVVLHPRNLKERDYLIPLFKNSLNASLDYWRRTGIYPIVHVFVARGPLLRQHPEAGRYLFELFTRAKEHAYANNRAAIESPLDGATFDQAREALGPDPYPLGVEQNAASIEAFLQYAHEQGLAARRLSIDEAFPSDVI